MDFAEEQAYLAYKKNDKDKMREKVSEMMVIEKKIPAEDWSAVPSDYSGIITATGSGAAAGTVKTLNFSDSSFTQQWQTLTPSSSAPTR